MKAFNREEVREGFSEWDLWAEPWSKTRVYPSKAEEHWRPREQHVQRPGAGAATASPRSTEEAPTPEVVGVVLPYSAAPGPACGGWDFFVFWFSAYVSTTEMDLGKHASRLLAYTFQNLCLLFFLNHFSTGTKDWADRSEDWSMDWQCSIDTMKSHNPLHCHLLGGYSH